ncbi:MAG: bifunctional diaminohydroxyphosphoribosylaminopyrimidine deaminase/5-amino-6-(5-phosphoribosylamino)uracil reductase RibD [Oscillospiraceae bacterium]|nr:bifunctional diaminohydroxyphosphoribosylaminopyrimidine deaminase/5-amino-6-(5-phosphoribosylamino)uracil reductase RibD [Oscillospiraceae bacterium]
MTHEHWMKQALDLACLGMGRVNPNPMVGSVIVKDGRLIGQGYHGVYGGPHAEREALAVCTEDPQGATLYATLEPCCHHGKTPPCTEAIIAAGISTVVMGSRDPNPKVDGGGVSILREHGITVIEGILQGECDALNAAFFHYIQGNTPYVVMKYAMTADGKIATVTGASRWITGEAARECVHETRHACSAILVGVGTVLADDPLLTCRLPEGRNPLRVICDSKLSTPLNSRIVTTAREVPTWIVTAGRARDVEDAVPYEEAGCRILDLPGADGRVDLAALMETLHREKIDSVLVEGGSTLNYSLLTAGLVQRLQVYIAPKIFGGDTAKGPVGGAGVTLPELAVPLGSPTVTQIGDDLLLEYDVLGGNA